MCIGIPMQIVAGEGYLVTGEGRGQQAQINMMLVDPQPVGTWVLVHLGSAVRILDPVEAAQINDALNALEAALRGESLEGYFPDLARH